MELLLEGIREGLRLLATADSQVMQALVLSLWVSLLATALAASVGLPVGLWVGLGRLRTSRTVAGLLNASMALPTVVVGLVVYALTCRRGPLGPLELLYTPWAMVMAQAILGLPIITALSAAAARTLDSRVRPTALTLGASPWQAAMTVVAEARLAVAGALAAAFGRLVTEVGAAIMVGGNIRGYTRTLTTAITLETAKGDLGRAMAMGLVLIVVALGVNMLASYLQARIRP